MQSELMKAPFIALKSLHQLKFPHGYVYEKYQQLILASNTIENSHACSEGCGVWSVQMEFA